MRVDRRHISLGGVARRAALATAALYLLQGLPVVLLLLYLRIGGGDEDGERENVFTVIPYWTGPAYVVGVGLFGLVLLIAPLLARRWSRKSALFTIAAATAAYCLSSIAGIIADADSLDYAVYATMYMLVFIFLSGSVAFSCAVAWSWRTIGGLHDPAA